MKKIFVCLLSVLVLCSCSERVVDKKPKNPAGVWITYYELKSMLKSSKGFKAEFSRVIENSKALNIKNLYIHTCAFAETLYNSDYFPMIDDSKSYDYDIFEHIVTECHKAELSVHAWINPYRVATNTEVEKLSTESPAYKWLMDDDFTNDINIGFANGIYFNPASVNVRTLIIDGVRELIAKYDVDGIHFDDYFYPTKSDSFDKNSYNEYKNSAQSSLSLEDWRRENVNLLVSSVYNSIKYINNNIIFSISPAASIEHNYNDLYADVSLWIKEGWIDEVIPQVYFGFEYPDQSFRFEELIGVWKNIVSQNNNVKLIIGLASYKAVPTLEADKQEWASNTDIIARQVKICDNENGIAGYVYFSYSSLFSEKTAYKKQRENILEYLKRGT